MTKNIFDFVAGIRQELQALRDERASIPHQLEAAVKGSDGSEVRRLKARQLEVEQAIIDLAEQGQKRLDAFSGDARKPLQQAVRKAEQAVINAKAALEDTRKENIQRERAAVAALTDAEREFTVTYNEHRAAADELTALGYELQAEFARFAGAA